MTTRYVPPSYKSFTFYIYFHTQTYIHSPQQLTEDQNTESSPQSSLPCGQRTPAGSTSTSDTPSPHTPPQPFVHSQQQPQIPTPTHHQNPINHKTFNIHLLKQMLTYLLSLPFQMKNKSVYPNRQMVVK